MKKYGYLIATAAIITLFTGCAPRSMATANDPLAGTKGGLAIGAQFVAQPTVNPISIGFAVISVAATTATGALYDIGRATKLISNEVPQSSDYYLTKESPKDDNVTAQHEAKWKAELDKSLKSE